MPTFDLRRLVQEDSVDVVGEWAEDDPLWKETRLAFAEPVKVNLAVRETGTGEVIATGTVSTVLDRACRRCLEKAEEEYELDVALVWSDDVELRGEDGEIRALPDDTDIVDVGPAVREELILAVPAYTECDPDCKGLCPQCGTNWNEHSCDCTTDEPDPRWDALRALQSE